MADDARDQSEKTREDAAPSTTLPVVSGVVLLIGAGLLAWSELSSGGGGGGAPPPGHGGGAKMPEKKPVAVTTAVVVEDALTEEQRIPGEVLSSRRAALKAEASGTLLRVRKKLGEKVNAGELLATIEAGTLPAEVERAVALAQIASARRERQAVVVEQLKRDVARKQKLESEGATSKTDREQTEHALALADADLAIAVAEEARARADVRILEMRLDDTRVTAPFSGKIARAYVDEGTVVTAGAPLFDIVDDLAPKVAFNVRESERARLRPGAPVIVQTLTSGEGAVVTGEVERIGAEVDPSTRTVLVEARLSIGPDVAAPLPGTFVDVTLALGATEQGLVVPTEALIGRGPVRTLYVVEDGLVKAVDVTVIVEDGARAAVSGAAKGAEVVVDGRDLVKDGSKVDVRAAKPRADGARGTSAKGAP